MPKISSDKEEKKNGVMWIAVLEPGLPVYGQRTGEIPELSGVFVVDRAVRGHERFTKRYQGTNDFEIARMGGIEEIFREVPRVV